MLAYSKKIEIINISVSIPLTNLFLQWISIIAFVSYGVSCFYSNKLIFEFKRYGCESWRKLIAGLEIAGGIGLLIGFEYAPLRVFCSACLAVLMICAISVRIKIKDPFLACVPAISLFFINLYLALL
jgi:hypothetical protein